MGGNQAGFGRYVGRALLELVWGFIDHVLGSGQWGSGDARSLRGSETAGAWG